jgi:hypothetical protein
MIRVLDVLEAAMEKGPIVTLLRMKEADGLSLDADIAQDTATLQDHERRVTEIRARLSDKISRNQRVREEVALLRSALGSQDATIPSNAEIDDSAFVIEVAAMPGAESKRIDLRSLDLSDNEPKVRQHTVEVRRRAAALLVRHGPSTTAELVAWLEKDRFVVSEDKQVANLSAILSRTSFFESRARRWHIDIPKLLSVRSLDK